MTEYYQKVLNLFKQYDLDKKGYNIDEYIGVYEENSDITLEIFYDDYGSIEFNVCIEHFNGDIDFTFKSSCRVDYEFYEDNFHKFISSEEEFKNCFRDIQGTETFYQLQENEKFVGCELIEKIIALSKE